MSAAADEERDTRTVKAIRPGHSPYVVEVAGRTEQHCCPIKHARRVQHTHDRYSHFLPYGDAHAYRERIDKVRDDFKDLKGRM